ncbi:hypothetical protein FQN54_005122 [Arachnomyces sp. PD_36]|nr:hypothetical protein FQN54_005122 [Arachnomyces sp. PD_36]
MGSSHFYLEFLMAWVKVLKDLGYRNPCIFALEYTLVPDKVYPTQVQEVLSGYQFVLSKAVDSSRICLSGDSAGATLILSLLLHYGMTDRWRDDRPGLALLISPWVTIVSSRNRDTPSDYLNMDSLHEYARQFVGRNTSVDNPLASPGKCQDVGTWFRASPTEGFVCFYGSEEVFQPEIARWMGLVRRAECVCDGREEADGVHAWPIVGFFTGETKREQLRGIFQMSRVMKLKIP